MVCGTVTKNTDTVNGSFLGKFAVGTVHWISFGDYPWWPARVAAEWEFDLDGIPDKSEVPVAPFKDGGRWIIVKKQDTLPFDKSADYHNDFTKYFGKYKTRLRSAVREANAYLERKELQVDKNWKKAVRKNTSPLVARRKSAPITRKSEVSDLKKSGVPHNNNKRGGISDASLACTSSSQSHSDDSLANDPLDKANHDSADSPVLVTFRRREPKVKTLPTLSKRDGESQNGTSQEQPDIQTTHSRKRIKLEITVPNDDDLRNSHGETNIQSAERPTIARSLLVNNSQCERATKITGGTIGGGSPNRSRYTIPGEANNSNNDSACQNDDNSDEENTEANGSNAGVDDNTKINRKSGDSGRDLLAAGDDDIIPNGGEQSGSFAVIHKTQRVSVDCASLPQETHNRIGCGPCAPKPEHNDATKKSRGENERLVSGSEGKGSDPATQAGLMAELVPVSSLMAAYKLLSKDQLIDLLIRRELEMHQLRTRR